MNIQLKFGIKNIPIDRREKAGNPFGQENASMGSYANPEIASKYVGYQRGERYRFAVIGFDEKLRPSFAHPINEDNGDVIFPDFGEPGDGTSRWRIENTQWEFTPPQINARILHPKFRITGLPESVKHLQIVRVPRDRGKRSVIDMGVAGFFKKVSDTGVDYEFTGNLLSDSRAFNHSDLSNENYSSQDKRFVEYTSPEILFNRLYEGVGTHLTPVAAYDDASGDFVSVDIKNSTSNSRVAFIRYNTYRPALYRRFLPIEESVVHRHNLDENASINISNKNIRGRTVHFVQRDWNNSTQTINAAKNRWGSRGTCMVLKLSFPLEFNHENEGDNIYYGTLARRRQNVQNGVPTNFYGDISANHYIPCSPVFNVDNNTINSGQWTDVFGGDIFINFFEYLRSTWNEDFADDKLVVSHSFITETTINTYLETNPNFNSLYSGTEDWTKALFRVMQEEAGVYSFADETEYRQDFNLYTYNTVYSRLNDVKTYFVKPPDVKFGIKTPTKIYHTDKKMDGEFLDNWTKIRPNNFINVDSRYGDITRIFNFKDTLFSFQKEGVSAIPVEQRELVQTNVPGPLVTGTGDIVSPPYYFSSKSGLVDYFGITSSKHALYYYDRSNNKICRVEENGVRFLSDAKSISSSLKDIKDSVSALYDRQFNEVIFNLYNGESLVFSEYKDLFTGNFTYNFERSVSDGKNEYILNNSVIQKINGGRYGQFEDRIEDSIVTSIVNPTGNLVVIYDILELAFEIFKNGEYILNEPVYSLRLYNEWQDSGEIVLKDEENIVQRFRTWRLTPLIDNTQDEGRLRSSSLFVELKFRNGSNKKVVLHDIITNIRSTKIR